jgi:hypothetical protein
MVAVEQDIKTVIAQVTIIQDTAAKVFLVVQTQDTTTVKDMRKA